MTPDFPPNIGLLSPEDRVGFIAAITAANGNARLLEIAREAYFNERQLRINSGFRENYNRIAAAVLDDARTSTHDS